MTKRLTFSEAMREADRMGLPDRRGFFIELDVSAWGGEKPPCCAIGGANVVAKGVEVIDARVFGRMMYEVSPKALLKKILCPACVECVGAANWVVPHLYDSHLWSRTHIADWLDSIFTPEELTEGWLDE